MENNIKILVCGILYDHSFSLLDKWGSIADNILYYNKFFNAKYFPQISTQYTTSRVLHNESNTHILNLSANNLIYTHFIEKNFNDEYKLFSERVAKYLVPEIIDKNDLFVRRIGVVFTVDAPDEYIQKFSGKYFKSEYKNIVDFRFSKKEPVIEAVMFGNNNYINKIFTIGTQGADSNKKAISFDYQYHYRPKKQYIKPDVPDFLRKGKEELEKEIF